MVCDSKVTSLRYNLNKQSIMVQGNWEGNRPTLHYLLHVQLCNSRRFVKNWFGKYITVPRITNFVSHIYMAVRDTPVDSRGAMEFWRQNISATFQNHPPFALVY